MPPTTFPKYWIIDVQKNADHKLLTKFKEWYNKVSDTNCISYMKYCGFDNIPYRNGYDFWDRITSFKNNPTLITLEEWNNHFFPTKQEKKDIPFKKIKNTPQYKTQKALAEHYEALSKAGVGELWFSNIQIVNLTEALDEIVAMTTDSLAKKVAEMAKERYETDKLIHARKLFSKK